MAINKITPRALDKSTDHKLVASTAFIDAVNVVFGDDEGSNGDTGGDRGVIKNLKGNTAAAYHTSRDEIADGDFKIIGSTTDHKLKVVYFYVYHEDLNEQGVWVYDPYGRLALPTNYEKTRRENNNIPLFELEGVDPYAEQKIKCVVKGSFFNFKQNSVVQGNIVYGNTLNVPEDIAPDIESNNVSSIFSIRNSDREVFEKDINLFFTDDINEPKKICVNGCMFARVLQTDQPNNVPSLYGPGEEARFASSEGGWFSLPTNNAEEIEKIKFCHACRPVPLSRPTFEFVEDPNSRVNNFETSQGFKFAYQVVYLDGSSSAISPKSEIAIPPSVLFQGNNKSPDHNIYNTCRISILDETISIWNHVKKVVILAQEGEGPYKIIHETSQRVGGVSFDFKNDIIGIPVAAQEENKFFDSVPQKAEAQAVVDNRLMYGNYVEGYPNEKVDATLEVVYRQRRSENFGDPVNVTPSVMLELDENSNDDGDVKQKMSGFRITIEDGDFPELNYGDELKFSVTFLPDKNFHVYNASNSYHQSRHLGIENNDDGNDYWQTPEESGVNNIIPNIEIPLTIDSEEASFNAFQNNDGVAKLTWKTVDVASEIAGSLPLTQEVHLGTSAAHPLIIPSRQLSFSCRVKYISENLESADTVRESFYDILDRTFGSAGTANYDVSSNAHFDLVSFNNYSTIEWDLPIENKQRVSEGDNLSKLISMIARDTFQSEYRQCGGAVVLKKGSAKFGLKKAALSEMAQDPEALVTSKTREYKIFLDSIPMDGLEIWTAVRKFQPGSPWWFLSPQFLQQVSDEAASLDSFYQNSYFEINSAFDNAGSAFVYGEGEQSPVFEQRNSAYDFTPPIGNKFSDTNTNVPLQLEGWEFSNFSLRTVIGYGFVQDPIQAPGEDESGLFVSAPVNESITLSGVDATVVDPRAKFFSVLDGEGGPGGSLPIDTLPSDYEHPVWSAEGRNPIYNGLNFSSSAYGLVNKDVYLGVPGYFGPWFTGKIHTNSVRATVPVVPFGVEMVHLNPSGDPQLFSIEDGYGGRTTMPLIQGASGGILNSGPNFTSFISSQYIYSDPTHVFEDGSWEDKGEITMSFSLLNPQIEFLTAPFFQTFVGFDASGVSNTQSAPGRSFKSSSDHDFGIVFYDSHGRRSFVNPIGSVYVGGYSTQERGNLQGDARVIVSLEGTPPRWADKYQFVYGGNKSISSFVQYTTNNAFIEPTLNEAEPDSDNGKIYLSLNLLQQSSISYAKEFGGRNKDGGLSIYKYSDGDKLRVISYGPADNRVYPKNVVFDIIELAIFDTLNPDVNPLITDFADGAAIGEQYFGEFLVLRNNSSASAVGLRYSDLLAGSDVWTQNVVFEVFSPKKATGVEAQVYEEIGGVYDISQTPTGERQYSQTSVVLTEGDVYFRPHAINSNNNNSVGNTWSDLLSADTDFADGTNDLKSNFVNLFLENTSASDFFASEIRSFGRPNIAASNAKTVRRESGIIYSERSNPDSDKFNYSSFNASLFPFKDLEERFGNINFMDELGGQLFVIQQDRCTMVPVSATLLSNALGQDQLIASNEILGKDRVFSVKAGCDNNPESVVRIDNTYYFAHKSLGKVFRFMDGQGIEEISDTGMGAFFRSKFKSAINSSALSTKSDVRIVGGYDPVKKEYLLTILTPKVLEVSSDDESVVVTGCQDPDSKNYNPKATRDDGSCEYEDDDEDLFACAELSSSQGLVFGNVSLGSVVQLSQTADGVPLTITNTGNKDLLIGDVFVQNDQASIFSANISEYSIAPGASANIQVTANTNTPGLFGSTIVVEFINSGEDCAQSVQIPASIQVTSDEVEDQVGVVTINVYLGGILIDQQFSQVNSGLWDVTIDQNRVIQSVRNGYSGDGAKALLEVEVAFDGTASVDLLPTDSITVSGDISNALDEFEFVAAGTAPQASVTNTSFEIRLTSDDLNQFYPVRLVVAALTFPSSYNSNALNVLPEQYRTGNLGSIKITKTEDLQNFVMISSNNGQNVEDITLLNRLNITEVSVDQEESTFTPCDLDLDGDGVVKKRDIETLYADIPFVNPALDINNDGIVDNQDYVLALEYDGFFCGTEADPETDETNQNTTK